jgi:hypothetical protein
MSPMKKEILKEVKKGNAPMHVVREVFTKRKLNQKLEQLVMDAVIESVKISGVRLK